MIDVRKLYEDDGNPWGWGDYQPMAFRRDEGLYRKVHCVFVGGGSMTQEELKQRLIELMGETQLGVNINTLTDNFWEQVFADLATNLIANGVTIRERGEWKDNHCTVCGTTPICEETWTSHDMTPPKFEWFMDFCPHCGADMRGVKDENGNDCKHLD